MQSDILYRFPSSAGGEAPEWAAPATVSSSPVTLDIPDMVPLLRRVPSGSRNRRAVGESQIDYFAAPSLTRRRSFRQDVGHAAAETYLLTRLTLILLRYLGVGYRWIAKFLALVCYALLLMPGFLQVGYYYFFSSQVRRSIIYGDQPRNRLDLYLPTDSNDTKPVVAFVTGGAWIIGYKAWGSLLGRRLAERGIIVACIDYRNFPQGTISDMVKDASEGISFVCNNITSYGGDRGRIYLMGQSAGAHIASCALVHQAIKECGEDEVSWSVSQINAFFGLSGGYNMFSLVDHFHRRGLYRSIFFSIMEGEQSLSHFSPEVAVKKLSARFNVSRLPSLILYHGRSDCSIPSDASTTFAEVLQSIGAQAKVVLYDGKTHTDLFLQDSTLPVIISVLLEAEQEERLCTLLKEYKLATRWSMLISKDPFRGGRDELLEDIISVIHAGDDASLAQDAVAPPARRLVPELMLQLARKVSPF